MANEDLKHLHKDIVSELQVTADVNFERYEELVLAKNQGKPVKKGEIAFHARAVLQASDLRDQIINNASKRID